MGSVDTDDIGITFVSKKKESFTIHVVVDVEMSFDLFVEDSTMCLSDFKDILAKEVTKRKPDFVTPKLMFLVIILLSNTTPREEIRSSLCMKEYADDISKLGITSGCTVTFKVITEREHTAAEAGVPLAQSDANRAKSVCGAILCCPILFLYAVLRVIAQNFCCVLRCFFDILK